MITEPHPRWPPTSTASRSRSRRARSTTLKIVIGAILFGIALDTKLEDFALADPPAGHHRHRGDRPVPAAARRSPSGSPCCSTSAASVALGMILVACCPPGNVSNILTHRARGDVALSVSMTAVGNVLAIFLMPLNVAFWGGLHPTGKKVLEASSYRGRHAGRDRPGHRGAVLRRPPIAPALPRVASRAGKPSSGPVTLPRPRAAVIVAALANNWSIFVAHIGVVLLAVFLHDALALLLGYGDRPATRLPGASTKAMTFEVGIRNAGLGLLLVFTYFDGLGGMALVAAWWGIWDIIAGLAVATVAAAARGAGRSVAAESRRAAHDARPGHRRQRLPRQLGRDPRLVASGHRGRSSPRPPRARAPVPGVELPADGRHRRRRRRRRLRARPPHRGRGAPRLHRHPRQGRSRDKEYAVDVDGTRHVLDACLAHGVRRVVVVRPPAPPTATTPTTREWLTEDRPGPRQRRVRLLDHKRLVEEMLAELRLAHPELEQVVLRIGTILGDRWTTRSPRCGTAAPARDPRLRLALRLHLGQRRRRRSSSGPPPARSPASSTSPATAR